MFNGHQGIAGHFVAIPHLDIHYVKVTFSVCTWHFIQVGNVCADTGVIYIGGGSGTHSGYIC